MKFVSLDEGEIFRIVAGRRHFNSLRREKMTMRRLELGEYIRAHGCPHGTQKLLAARYGVSPGTISRDIKSISKTAERCPACGRYRERLEAFLQGREPISPLER